MSDQQLERGVAEFLKTRQIGGLETFQVEVHNGIVVIHGTVVSEFARWACRECCRHVTGVQRVVDDLQIQPA